MPPKAWTISDSRTVVSTRIFTVSEDSSLSPRSGENHQVTRLLTPDWVNVVAVTANREVVLVRQWRHGTRSLTLEIPGGMVDPEEDPAIAAARELREETGYQGHQPRYLGVVHPNPAFMDNRCSTFLLENCQLKGQQDQDPGEDIEVVVKPLEEIPQLIARGEITNSLVVCAFWWLKAALPDMMGTAE